MSEELLNRIAELERRVLSLEGLLHKRGGLAGVVRHIVKNWPGPFTAQQIRDAVYKYYPNHKPIEEHHQIEVIITRIEKQGFICKTFEGRGPSANIYEIVQEPPAGAGRKGTKLASHAGNESGFRNIVRGALDELPEKFTLADLKKWLAEKMPDAQIPQGSWSSTLYKLTQSEELICVKGSGTNVSANRKLWTRGPRRVTPSGDELRDVEKAWLDFRSQMDIQPTPELLPALQREET